jgi:hypothetical protein
MASLAYVQRQIARSQRRLAQMEEQHGAVFTPRRVWAPRPETIAKLEADIRALPATTLCIDFALAKELVKAVRRLNGRQVWLSHRVASLSQQLRDLKYKMKLTSRLVCSQDLPAIHDWLVNRKDDKGRNANAVAMGRISSIRRRHADPDCYRKIGRLGAAAKWKKYRAAKTAAASSEPPPASSTPE